MAVVINDDYLEKQIEAEAEHRGHKTNAKTAAQLIQERLTQLQFERRHEATEARREKQPAA